ncbi:MAG: acyl--CoA ligase [Burkholderiales bacterium]|nr:acyl--CoA ligase [Burkholderiales bacterium]
MTARCDETLTAALERHARERPGAAALVDDRDRLTWGAVKAWVDRAAGWFGAQRLPRGAAVLGWLPNCAELYLVRLACEQAGLFWVPVPASQGKRELASIAERVRPHAVVALGRFRERDFASELDEVLAALRLAPLRATVRPEALLDLEGAGPAEPLRPEEPAHALATTGSEGVPKLAVYTLAAACARAHAQAALLALSPADVLLTLSPGVGPARAAWLAAPVAGSCVVALPVFGTEAALELIAAEHTTIVCGSPSQLAMLAARLEHADTSSVRLWYTAGAVLSASLAAELEARTGARVVSTYGGADFGGWAAPALDDPPAVRHGTVGRPRGGTEMKVIDPEGRALPQGAVGEVVGRGPCCVGGYLSGPGSERWRDGWFHTGDLGYWRDDGNLVIVGRLKDVIIRGGDNVSPSEVEALLRTDPDVAEAAVIGVPDTVFGERVCACIVPVAGRAPGLESLRAHLRGAGLAPFKLPERLLLLEVLPMVGDKIDRRALQQRAADSASLVHAERRAS